MVLVGAIVLAFVGYVIYLGFDFNKGLSTTRSVILSDLEELHRIINTFDLLAWPYGDIDILSRIGESNLSKKMFGDVETSILYSIYHEPILAIATKYYLQDETMSYAIKFDDTSYTLSEAEDSLKVLANNEDYFATINPSELAITQGDLSVVIQYRDGTDLVPVLFNGVIKLLINAHDSEDVDQTRAIVKKERISNQERDLFILILSFGLIKQHI